MATAPFKLHEDYWDLFQIDPKDLEFLYNHLLEIETPLTSRELTIVLVLQCIAREKQAIQNRQLSDGKIFIPKETYAVGDAIIFPALDWQKGKVLSSRNGYNPDSAPFNVIEVKMSNGVVRQFADTLEEHNLNQPIEIRLDDPFLDPEYVIRTFGDKIIEKLETALNSNPDLVCIANRWFPRALLVDVNIGHLNLTEAALDMIGGGPMSTKELLDQIDLPTDVNSKLTEFSLNYALIEDPRFDEVGSLGEVTWFLHRLEPEPVRQVPTFLNYSPVDYDPATLSEAMVALEQQVDDELSIYPNKEYPTEETEISLIYPHWRSGTLPLTFKTCTLFPTALESPRIQFTLIDKDSGDKYPGWVVRPNRYIYGLQDWYTSQGIIPGSLIHIQRGKNPGEVFIKAEKRRSNREWIRTILVGADGGIVFAMLKQMVSAAFDERMVISIPDIDLLDQVWQSTTKQKISLFKSVLLIMRELAKLNPQGHVHAQELYAALNVVRRCPPGPLFSLLSTQPIFIHVGDLHYRLDEAQEES
jgi:hypothetical protein